jgi:antitoxin CptB
MDDRRKRLILRAWRRGFQEMDLICGQFADARAADLSEADLTAFEALLQAPDQDVYDWLLGRSATPSDHDTPLFAQLRAHAFAGANRS